MGFRIVSVAFAVIFALIHVFAIAGQNPKPGVQGAAALVGAARDAMGGEAKLAAVKSLILKGEERGRNEWFGVVPGAAPEWFVRPVEMKMLFPDRFLRIWGAWGPARSVRSGFSGEEPVPAREPGKALPQNWQESLDADRAYLGRLMLILLVRTNGAAPAMLQNAASGTALEFSGLGRFPSFLDLDKTTHLPVRLRYRAEMRTAAGPTGEISDMCLGADDWQDVDGIKIARHITISRNGKIYTDYRFDTIQVNPPLTAADFK